MLSVKFRIIIGILLFRSIPNNTNAQAIEIWEIQDTGN